MKIRDQIKIETIKHDVTLSFLANQLGISRQNLNHHLERENKDIIHKIEKILGLKYGYFTYKFKKL